MSFLLIRHRKAFRERGSNESNHRGTPGFELETRLFEVQVANF